VIFKKEYSWKNSQKILLESSLKKLYYFDNVCVTNLPKICHFQNFASPFIVEKQWLQVVLQYF
jgi:hypothetical protein